MLPRSHPTRHLAFLSGLRASSFSPRYSKIAVVVMAKPRVLKEVGTGI
jgi:hypothetical protein